MIRLGVVEIEDEVVYHNSECQLKVNSGEFARGSLVLTKSEICWKRENTESGFMIPWEKVTVQAITQEPQRSVYFMIDVFWPEQAQAQANGANGNHNEEEDADDDEGNESEGSLQEVTEFHIIFDSAEEVDVVYYLMTKFPEDPPMEDSSDDDFFDGEMEQMNLNDEERFADAD